eukprot:COSAG06_NODE_34968_length_466_cov_1.386921_2_plen_40_part_01
MAVAALRRARIDLALVRCDSRPEEVSKVSLKLSDRPRHCS